MTPDEKADEMLTQARNEIAALTSRQALVYGYVTAMRGLPAYLDFSRRNPGFGNVELANEIASGFRLLVLTGEAPPSLRDLVELLDERYVPDSEDFGSECEALEAALALVFLHRYVASGEPGDVVEILRGTVECILMSGDAPQVLRALTAEQSLRRRRYELIGRAGDLDEGLLDRCLAVNGSASPHPGTDPA